MLKIIGSLFILLLLSGCEEKAVPVSDQPSETTEKEYQQGDISTH